MAIAPISDGGTGTGSFTTGSIPFIGATTFIEDNSNLFYDNTNKRLGLGTTTPTDALDLALNNRIHLSTDKNTAAAEGLIKLHYTTNEAKAIIAYIDENDHEVIWLQAHNYLSYPTNQHKHFSIEASDAAGNKQTRLGVGYGADNVDVTVNQADLVINRNTSMTNGNILFQGGGGGGNLKHANSFSFYPSYVSNSTYALQVSLASTNQVTLSATGSSILYIGDTLSVTGSAVPTTSDGGALGSASQMWSDLFLASGGVINFNNGDVTLTHSADTLTVGGGTLVTNDIALTSGSNIRTRTTAGSTYSLQARDVDGGTYTTFATLTANNTPTFDVQPTSLTVQNDHFTVTSAKTPSSATDTGTAGGIAWDSNYMYVCIASNTWKRSPLTTW